MFHLQALLLLALAPSRMRASASWTSDSAIQSISYTDTYEEAGYIKGFVTWTPPANPVVDGVQITRYMVFIANDAEGNYPGQLWDQEAGDDWVAYGTNRLQVWEEEPLTSRLYVDGRPAFWIMVRAWHPNLQLQPVEYAAKMIFYDLSPDLPHSLTFDSISFTDEDEDQGEVGGTLQWTPAVDADLGFSTHYKVFLASDAQGSGATQVAGTSDIPVGTNEVAIPSGTSTGGMSHLVVYAKNPNGETLLSPLAIGDLVGTVVATTTTVLTTTVTTTATTTTTLTATTTTAAAGGGFVVTPATSVTDLTFTDSNEEAGAIGDALISWTPPTDTSQISFYTAYIAYDTLGTEEAQLWFYDSVNDEYGTEFAVGTNQWNLYDPTGRATLDFPLYPANYLIIYSQVSGARQSVSDATKVLLYDLSESAPDAVSLTFDLSGLYLDGTDIAGTVQWTPVDYSDLAYTQHWAVYTSESSDGSSPTSVEDVPAGTNQLAMPAGHQCDQGKYIGVFAKNSIGQAATGTWDIMPTCPTTTATTTATTTTSSSTTATATTTTGTTTTTSTTTATSSTSTTTTFTTEAGASTSTVTVTTVTATTTTTVSASSVTDLTFTDIDEEAYQIGGAVLEWTPPSDMSQVTSYAAYIAYDELGAHQAQLWQMDPETGDYSQELPVGTNQFHLFVPTARESADHPSYPANWLLVYSKNGDTLQDVAHAAKVPLYDLTSSVPSAVSLSISFTDTDPEDASISGIVFWEPAAQADLGFATHYDLYLAEDAAGANQELLQSVPMGTEQFFVPTGTYCWESKHLLVYLRNPNGLASTASSLTLEGCTTPRPTTTTTTTTTTTLSATTTTTTATSSTTSTTTVSTTTTDPDAPTVTSTTTTTSATATTATTTTIDPTIITDLSFTDVNDEAGQIGGAVVQWTPPTYESQVSRYQVYAAHDEQGSQMVQLWWLNAETEEYDSEFIVGTNSFTLYDPTTRATASGSYPANWLLVFTVVGGTLQDVADAAKVPLYDLSSSVPSKIDMTISFTDTDPETATIAGTLQWEPAALSDLAYTTQYDIYLAEDDAGANEVSLQSVAVGTNELVIPTGTNCWTNNHLLVYASNPNGRASSAAFTVLEGCSAPAPTTTTTSTSTSTGTTVTDTSTTLEGQSFTSTTTTTTSSTSTSSTTATTTSTFPPHTVTNLAVTDQDAEAGLISGALVQWSPPADTSPISNFEVYIAYDEQGSYAAQLFWQDPLDEGNYDSNFEVGTNQFNLFNPTGRQTTNGNYPANWLLVYSRINGALQSADDAAKVRLYDDSGSAPPSSVAVSVDGSSTSLAGEEISGSVQWTVDTSTPDFGYTQNFAVFAATDAGGSSEVLVQDVVLGTNSLAMPAGRTCAQGSYVNVFLENQHGKTAAGQWTLLAACVTTTTTTSTATTTTTSSTSSTTSLTSTTAATTAVAGTTAADGGETNTTTTSSTTLTSTTVSTTTTTTIALTSVTDLLFTDTNMDAQQIGGATVQWTPPADVSQTDYFSVYIASDETGTAKTNLWYITDSGFYDFEFPVGTNQFTLYEPTQRVTSDLAYPANWVLVLAHVAGSEQPIANAATVHLYDASSSVPSAISMSISFTDTDPEDSLVSGTVQWVPADRADFGYTTHYAAYLAQDSSGTLEEFVLDVPVGTNELVIPDGTQCWDKNHLLVYAVNPNGKAASASYTVVSGCTTPRPTTTTTTTTSSTATLTTTTSTTSSSITVTTDGAATTLLTTTLEGADSSTSSTTSSTTTTSFTTTTTVTSFSLSVTQLTFVDGDATANMIAGGIIQWIPPTDTSDVTRYVAYIAYDSAGAYQAQLWSMEEEDEFVAVGTNQWTVYENTARQTLNADADYPANWLILYVERSGVLESVDDAAKIRLYDESGTVPPTVSVSVSFTDSDATAGKIEGDVQWTVADQADLGFMTHYAVYMAEDNCGTSESYLGQVAVGTNSLAIPAGTENGQRLFLLVYAANSHGRSALAEYVIFTDQGAAASSVSASACTTSTGTSTTTATTTTTAAPVQITGLSFSDTDTQAGSLTGRVRWTPPDDVSAVTHYLAYIAYDAQGTWQGQLWTNDDIGDSPIPVGTNQFYLYEPTPRGTSQSAYPANWLLVYAVLGGEVQPVSDAAKLPLYDVSSNVPSQVDFDMSFTDADPLDYQIEGTLQFTPAEFADLGHATYFFIYTAEDAAGTNRRSLGYVARGTNELVIPAGTECFDRNHILIYAGNPNGMATSGSSLTVSGCNTPYEDFVKNSTTSTSSTTTVSTTTTTTSSPLSSGFLAPRLQAGAF